MHLGVTDWMLQFVTQRGLLVLQSEDTVANRLLIKDHRLAGFLFVKSLAYNTKHLEMAFVVNGWHIL